MKQGIYLSVLLVLSITACENSISGSNFDVLEDKEVVNDTINYLALGDSYTIGQSVDPGERWPNQLITVMKENNYKVGELKIIARTGWTTRNLLDAIESEDLGQFNLASLLIGVNNQFQGKPFELFEEEFIELLDKAIDFAGGAENVFVVSIPDYGVTPFGSSNAYQIALELDQYNDYMSDVCDSRDIPFIDITSISRIMGDDNGALAYDNLHPSGQQYSRWVESIYPIVDELLEEQ